MRKLDSQSAIVGGRNTIGFTPGGRIDLPAAVKLAGVRNSRDSSEEDERKPSSAYGAIGRRGGRFGSGDERGRA